MYRYILFDLDGTLTDPGEGITNSVAYALGKFGIINTDRTELYKFIGPPLTDSFREYFGFTEAQSAKAVEYYREYYRNGGIFENEVYPGTEEMLRGLKSSGRTVALATSKPEEFANRILEHFGLSMYFDAVIGATMDGKLSRKTDVIRHAVDLLGISDLSEAVMVGDREHDILGAKANGLDSVGVLYGYGNLAELEAAGADFTAVSPADLAELLLKK